ncbi:MAG TPA: site-2 protease family protein [Bacillota bacterium]
MLKLHFQTNLPALALLGLLLVMCGNLPVFLLLLAALALHEVSHLLANDLWGYPGGRFQLTPWGGQLQLDPLFALNPDAEWFIAASGPLANWLMVAGVAYLNWLGLNHAFLSYWKKVNLLVGTINLIPALPLDGGRIVHACLSRCFGLTKAATVSKILAGITAILLFCCGAVSLAGRRNGSLFLIITLVIGLQLARIKTPALDLTWKLRQHKKELLAKAGLLNARTILVTPQTLIKDVLSEYGTNDYLLFIFFDASGQLWLVSEEQAWQSLVAHGFHTTFLETMKAGLTINLQKVNR